MSSLSENSFNTQYMEELPLKSDEELEKLAESKDFYKSQAAKITLMQRKITTKK